MTNRNPRIRNIGHIEDGSVVVEYAGVSLAVIDTGGDYRITEWCPIQAEWNGRELGVYGDRRPAIDRAAELTRTLPR